MNRLPALLFALLLSPLCQAGEGRDRLDVFVNDIKSMSADFTQELSNENGDLLESSSGKVFLKRPGRFRWDYQSPYEQHILTDGKRIWVYDIDLEQITIQPMAQTLSGTPALLLGGEVDLDTSFDIAEVESDDALAWVELMPRAEEGQYASIRLGFSELGLEAMRLFDNFGQMTRIRFSNQQRDLELEEGLFLLDPPEGVDIIDATRKAQ